VMLGTRQLSRGTPKRMQYTILSYMDMVRAAAHFGYPCPKKRLEADAYYYAIDTNRFLRPWNGFKKRGDYQKATDGSSFHKENAHPQQERCSLEEKVTQN
jgi:hypothetical protein